MDKEVISEWFRSLQDNITREIEKTDGKAKFADDTWLRPEGGGGRSRVITKGNIIEKGAVNFSAVGGVTPQSVLKGLNLTEGDFFATGVSIIMHPYNPMVPIIHMNVRYFEMSTGVKWFGGGIDLTPHYVNQEDAVFFHKTLKDACDNNNPEYYAKYKKWADDYFYIKHRQETRGIGGIFFDRLSSDTEEGMEKIFNFVKDIGNSFAPIYTNLMSKNNNISFGEREKHWQMLRRSRYVEFNLVYDAGTKFGLETDGRIESILVSMPPQAIWEYDYKPEMGSIEQETLDLLKKDISWV